MTDRIISRFNSETTALEVVKGIDLKGRVAMVTGGASGIGLEISRALAAAGATVIIADVDDAKSLDAVRSIGASHPGSGVETVRLDLGSIASVRETADGLLARNLPLDILIENAGVMAPPLGRTKEGHELQFGINFLGHFELARCLEPALINSGKARVVCVSSIGHRRADVDFEDPDFKTTSYDRWKAYGQSKTACALLAVALNERLSPYGVTVNTMNPGGSMTGLQRHLTREEMQELGWIDEDGNVLSRWRSPQQCAATPVWLATAPEVEGRGGRYFEFCNESGPWSEDNPNVGVKPYALSIDSARRLWRLAEQLVG
ncbi:MULTISPECIES: SDR family NAD(P)-dependent oxidoreductase [unclassified Chelatococcus]|uniref:SDR family NAD(P)-dependent oxidoreductase n=1 Tax=unclassified Chelatococcus TaxID=2638111 RepID=UPI001BCB13B2|nr:MULTISPECIES: SDR family NAD(P)-dependent oxidoreductase [unclassified Chelatococcus]MBS7699941.1 SDR family NAD(P)-dependent oxidoreductase [Chelatococcus sp. YT9]MBX3558634.1 SDR family NAD(P)-dependent oxidoreductase [Chelatococcus sp.]